MTSPKETMIALVELDSEISEQNRVNFFTTFMLDCYQSVMFFHVILKLHISTYCQGHVCTR